MMTSLNIRTAKETLTATLRNVPIPWQGGDPLMGVGVRINTGRQEDWITQYSHWLLSNPFPRVSLLHRTGSNTTPPPPSSSMMVRSYMQ